MKMIMEHLVEDGPQKYWLAGGKAGNHFHRYQSRRIQAAPTGEWSSLSSYSGHIYSGFSVESGQKAMEQLLENKELPSAIICINDMIASGALVA